MRDTERKAETQAEGEADSVQEVDPGSPGSCSVPKAGGKLLTTQGSPIYPNI